MRYETICKYCGNAFIFANINRRKLPDHCKLTDIVECPQCGKELFKGEPGFYPWREVKDECK